MKYLPIIAFLLVSCAKDIPKATIVPSLEVASQTVKHSQTISKDTEKVIQTQKKALTDQKERINKAIDLSDDKVKGLLEEVAVGNMFIEDTNTELYKLNTQQQESIIHLTRQIEMSQKVAIEKDEETNKLRTSLSKEKVVAAKAKVYRNWVFGIVGAIVLYFTVTSILRIYKPF